MEAEKYIRRCIELAQGGRCGVSPNPMVGAVVVCEGRIIGEGYHVRCGEAHAEVNAIRSVADESLLKRSTLYVSLEPCVHQGKTPPCVDLILDKGIPRIVIGCQDPFAQVAGRGIERLRRAGREVTVGILQDECLALIERFAMFHTLHRPFITLKWAESADHFLDRRRPPEEPPTQLSSSLTQLLAHKLRSEADAVMVGRLTALLDNPRLTVRHWAGRNPLRVVLDRRCSLPPHLHLMDGSAATLVFTEGEHPQRENLTYVPIDFTCHPLTQVVAHLHRLNIQSLLVEGGSQLLRSMLDEGLWDEACVEQSPVVLHEGVAAPVLDEGLLRSTSRHFGRLFRHYTRKSR